MTLPIFATLTIAILQVHACLHKYTPLKAFHRQVWPEGASPAFVLCFYTNAVWEVLRTPPRSPFSSRYMSLQEHSLLTGCPWPCIFNSQSSITPTLIVRGSAWSTHFRSPTVFSAHLMHQEIDESFVPVLLWREKPSTNTNNSGISLSEHKWWKIN